MDLVIWSGGAAAVLTACTLNLFRAGRSGRLLGLPPQRLRAAPWGGAAGIFAILVMGWSQYLVQRAGSDLGGQLLLNLAFVPVQLALTIAAIVYSTGTWPYRGGFTSGRWSQHIAAGFAGWLLFVPLTTAVHIVIRWIAKRLGESSTSDHPLIRSLESSPDNWPLWVLIGLQAVVAAPLVEEVVFRGVIQPWAIRRPHGGDLLACFAALFGMVFSSGQSPEWWVLVQPLAFVAVGWYGLLAAGRWFDSAGWSDRPIFRHLFPAQAAGSVPGSQIYRGVVGTSLLFGMVHAGSWPDPVPLTVLSLGLGWLAHRTQSMIPPIVCHALFNALTMYEMRVLTLINPAAGTG